jgi:hypothetical protein
MKTLGQMLMDAYARADTIETVALVGDRLRITHKPNACEQIEAAFTQELEKFMEDRMESGSIDGFLVDCLPNDSRLYRVHDKAKKIIRTILGIPISKDT